jgi:tetratricopeptide (TPR) repeat protein
VAVCKKVLRLIPARYDVLTKLGLIRKKQGLAKEAESYYSSFLDRLLLDQQIGPTDVNSSCQSVADEMGDSAPILAKTYDCMVKFDLKDETAGVLEKLYRAQHEAGDEAGKEETKQRLQEMGIAPEEPQTPDEGKDGVVITEENIWSASHTEGERMGGGDSKIPSPGAVPMGTDESRPDSVYEYGDLDMEAKGGEQEKTAATSTQTMPEPSVDAETAQPDQEETVYDITSEEEEQSPPHVTVETNESPAPEKPPASTGIASSPQDVHVSAIIGDLESGTGEAMTEDDYRSHYDLGMAYLEMDLLAEAVREFQLASKSEAYQARALEMIGQCFLKQNQPNLAIKQLTKGLQVIGDDDAEALGIKYNLGLAYEMIGDIEQARSAFEDVYVEDVTFREVAKKIEKYS